MKLQLSAVVLLLASAVSGQNAEPPVTPAKKPAETKPTEEWVSFLNVPSKDAETRTRLTDLMREAGIPCGFHGSRAYAMEVRRSDLAKARKLIEDKLAAFPNVHLWPRELDSLPSRPPSKSSEN